VGEGGARAVLLADVDSLVERSLALEPGPAIVKVGHHGSGSSSGAAFLARLRPARAIVSCGRRNPFGHPDPRALARPAAGGARVERTDHEGALWFEPGPDGARRIEWREASGATPIVESRTPGAVTAPLRQ